MDIYQMEQIVSDFENVLFRQTAFSKNNIEEDLRIREAIDVNSKALGRRTNELGIKKQAYISGFNDWSGKLSVANNTLCQWRNDSPHDEWVHSLIDRCGKCRRQVDELRSIVQFFG